MGREAATKALLDAGITYDKVQQVRNNLFCSHTPSSFVHTRLAYLFIRPSRPPFFRSKANSEHLHDFFFFPTHRLLSDTVMVILPAVSAPCTSSECTR